MVGAGVYLSRVFLLGLIGHFDLSGSGDGSVGVSGCGIVGVQLTICRTHHLQEGKTATNHSNTRIWSMTGKHFKSDGLLHLAVVFTSESMSFAEDTVHPGFYKCASNVTHVGSLDVC